MKRRRAIWDVRLQRSEDYQAIAGQGLQIGIASLVCVSVEGATQKCGPHWSTDWNGQIVHLLVCHGYELKHAKQRNPNL